MNGSLPSFRALVSLGWLSVLSLALAVPAFCEDRPPVGWPLDSEEQEAPDRASVNVGLFIPYNGKVTRFQSGDVTFADRLLPTVGIEYRFRWDRFPGLSLISQVWGTPLGSPLQDGAGSSRWISTVLLVGKQQKNAEFRAGGGWLHQWISGAGGESQQDNGNGTQTYFLPDRSVLARMLTLQAGLGLQKDRLRFTVDLIGTGVLTSRRTANAWFSVGWSFH